MGLIRHYLRVFFRSHFKPINVRTASRWEFNSSMLYLITSCIVFGYAAKMYMRSSEKGTVGDARIYDPYQLMLRWGTKKEFTVLDISGKTVDKQVLTLEEVEKKAAATGTQ